MKTILIFLVLNLLALPAFATVNFQSQPIDCENELRGWRSEMNTLGRAQVRSGEFQLNNGLTLCRSVAGFENVVLCQSFLQLHMNYIFGRASIYAEGGNELSIRSLATHDHPDMERFNLLIQGHDLKSKDLTEFFAKVEKLCAEGHSEMCLNAYEAEFKEKVLIPLQARFSEFVVLGFSFQSFDGHRAIVGHEIMHAQYFVDAVYRQTVQHFWETVVTAEDRTVIRRELSERGYDLNDEDLMQNEFQAFILESDASEGFLHQFSSKYAAHLRSKLTAAGRPPFEVR